MAGSDRVIPLSLRANKAFLSDLQRLVGLAPEILSALKPEMAPHSALDESVVEAVAQAHGADPASAIRAVTVGRYLIARSLETDASATHVMDEIREIYSNDLGSQVPDYVQKLFERDETERRDFLEREAFAAPPTYLGSALRPVLVASSAESDTLVGGFYWRLSFADSEGETRTVTFGLSSGELSGLVQDIEDAQTRLRRILKGRLAEGAKGGPAS